MSIDKRDQGGLGLALKYFDLQHFSALDLSGGNSIMPWDGSTSEQDEYFANPK